MAVNFLEQMLKPDLVFVNDSNREAVAAEAQAILDMEAEELANELIK